MRQSKKHGQEKEVDFQIPEDPVKKNAHLLNNFILNLCGGDEKQAEYVIDQAVLFEKKSREFKARMISDRNPGESLEDYKKRTVQYCQVKANIVMGLSE